MLSGEIKHKGADGDVGFHTHALAQAKRMIGVLNAKIALKLKKCKDGHPKYQKYLDHPLMQSKPAKKEAKDDGKKPKG